MGKKERDALETDNKPEIKNGPFLGTVRKKSLLFWQEDLYFKNQRGV